MENESVSRSESSRNVYQNYAGYMSSSCLPGNRSVSIWSIYAKVPQCYQVIYPQPPHKSTMVYTKVDYNITGIDLCLPLKCLYRTLLWPNNETLYCKSNQFNKQKFVLHISKWGLPQYLHYHLLLGLLLILPHEFFHVVQSWNLSFDDLGANRISQSKI